MQLYFADPFGAEWMENGDLLQLLDIHLADSPDIPEAPPNFLADDLLSTKGSDAAEKVAPNVQKCYEFLQDLLKQNNETSIVVPSHQEVSVELPIVKPSHADIKLLVGEEVIVDFESPFSVDDVESLLSSAVPSPSSTIDSSSLSDSNSIVCKSELYQLVSNVTEGQKSRGSPYSRSQSGSRSPKSKGRKQTASISPSPSDHELEFMSKKDRKKLQNKNAAIRYRMKKKEEADSVKDEESQLEEINQNLTEKVEQLTREIKYMKDLIIEVRKARGL